MLYFCFWRVLVDDINRLCDGILLKAPSSEERRVVSGLGVEIMYGRLDVAFPIMRAMDVTLKIDAKPYLSGCPFGLPKPISLYRPVIVEPTSEITITLQTIHLPPLELTEPITFRVGIV